MRKDISDGGEMMKNDKDIRTSNKLKRLERLKEERPAEYGKNKRFSEEFSEETLTKEQLEKDLPDYEI